MNVIGSKNGEIPSQKFSKLPVCFVMRWFGTVIIRKQKFLDERV